MCFSATASFTAAAILVPLGGYAIAKANTIDKSYLPLASFPLFFGIQQALEGTVWLNLAQGEQSAIYSAALGFMFFSHFFWLAWVPYSSWSIEQNPRRKKIFSYIVKLGLALGLYLYLQLLLDTENRLNVVIVEHSIFYETKLFLHEYVHKIFVLLIYATLIIFPLVANSNREVRNFGITILASIIFTGIYFSYAYISVWCFFAAYLSLHIIWGLRKIESQRDVEMSGISE